MSQLPHALPNPLHLQQDYRNTALRQAQALEWVTVVCCLLETVGSILFGVKNQSLSLLGFGGDSLIELASAVTLLWFLRADRAFNHSLDRKVLKLIGLCFCALAVFIVLEAAENIFTRHTAFPELSAIGVAVFSLLSMPTLAYAKRRVGRELGSAAVGADAAQSALCGYLALILLVGLLLNRTFGWWWVDPVASLAMVPIVIREAMRAFQGHTCSHCEPVRVGN